MYTRTTNIAVLLALVLALGAPSFGQTNKERADHLIGVLKSDASQVDKADACRQLGVYGTKEAVPVLAGLLADEKLAHMARYAMEPIPDASVDDAFRDALGKLKGRLLVGVIGSVGVRQDVKGIEPLAKLQADSDAAVAQAAARALGKIGSADAAKAIQAAMASTAAGNQVAFCEGLFRCAESLAAKGQRDQAVAIYDHLRGLNSSHHQVRAGALRGAILARQDGRIPLLLAGIGSDDFVLVHAAARTAMELSGSDVTKAIADELPKLNNDKKILMLQVLGKRGDAAALPAVVAAAKSGEKAVRIVAIRAMGEVGNAAAMSALLDLMKDSDREIAQRAQEVLASLPGKDVDAAVVAMLGSADGDVRLTGIDLIGRRRMVACVPALLKASAEADAKVRSAAMRTVRDLATANELPALLELLMSAKESDIDAAEQAVSTACARAEKPESCVPKVTALLPQAQPNQKIALLRVLSGIGGADALNTLRATVKDANAEPKVRTAAIRAMGAWKTADAGLDLLALAKSGSSATDKTLGLRGYLGLAARSEIPAEQRFAMCKEAAGLVERPEEKRLLLGALSSIYSSDSVAMIMPYVDDAATKEEACMAVATVCVKLLQGPDASKVAAKLVDPLGKVAQTTTNADVARRVRALQQQARNRSSR